MAKTATAPKAAKSKAEPAGETRRFKMHPKLLLDVIQRQAGSLAKAILEGVMNSVDAGAESCVVSIKERTVLISDDGKGITKRADIETFFETFGQPHDESEGKVYGTFRMGRGQMFAFGRNRWRTGPFEMHVDVKTLGLDYQLRGDMPEQEGCHIQIGLYEPLKTSDLAETERLIRKWVKYAPITVEINGEDATVDPADEKWDHVLDEAYIKLLPGRGELAVYNLGVHTMDLGGYQYGTGGVIVSREQLKVNFARNDIQSTCPVWRKVKPFVARQAEERIRREPELNDHQRQRICHLVAQGEPPEGAFKLKLFTTASGKHMSAEQILREQHTFNGKLSHCPLGNRLGDKLLQQKVALVLADECMQRFSKPLDGVIQLVYGLDTRLYGRRRTVAESYRIVDFKDLAAGLSDEYDILDEKDLTAAEKLWLDLCERAYHLLLPGGRWDEVQKARRRLVIGEADAADGWTDGTSYIALDRRYLRRLTLDARGITALGIVLLHEYCHTDADAGTHTHSLEFYEDFHNRCREKLPEFVNGCLGRLPNVLKMAKKTLSRTALKELDRAAVSRLAMEELLENTKIAADVDAAAG